MLNEPGPVRHHDDLLDAADEQPRENAENNVGAIGELERGGIGHHAPNVPRRKRIGDYANSERQARPPCDLLPLGRRTDSKRGANIFVEINITLNQYVTAFCVERWGHFPPLLRRAAATGVAAAATAVVAAVTLARRASGQPSRAAWARLRGCDIPPFAFWTVTLDAARGVARALRLARRRRAQQVGPQRQITRAASGSIVLYRERAVKTALMISTWPRSIASLPSKPSRRAASQSRRNPAPAADLA